jgi:hypothetical protein
MCSSGKRDGLFVDPVQELPDGIAQQLPDRATCTPSFPLSWCQTDGRQLLPKSLTWGLLS